MKTIACCCASILLLLFTSCKDRSDKKKSASDNKDSETMFLALMKFSSNRTVTYQFNGTEFEIIDHKSKGSFYSEFSDGTIKEKQYDDQPGKKPDAEKGEYDKWIIEEMNNETATLRYEGFQSNIKERWCFHCEYTRGTYSDFMNGKTVELALKADELDEYEASAGKALLVMFANRLGFIDMKTSKATRKLDDYTICLSKKSLKTSYKVKKILELFVVSELHDTSLKLFKSTVNTFVKKPF